MIQVVVFTATRVELHAVRRAIQVERRDRVAGFPCLIGHRGRTRVYLVQTGVGPERASVACRDFFRRHPADLAVSAGFACSLLPSHVGELLIGTEVAAPAGAGTAAASAVAPTGIGSNSLSCFPAAPAAMDLARRSAGAAGLEVRAGRFVTVSRVLWRAEDKRAMADRTGALGLDMESAAIGAVAADHRVPFVIVRTVSDLVNEDLPLDFNLFQGPGGWGRGLAAALSRPACVIGLYRLRGQAAVAAAHLTRFFERFFDAQE